MTSAVHLDLIFLSPQTHQTWSIVLISLCTCDICTSFLLSLGLCLPDIPNFEDLPGGLLVLVLMGLPQVAFWKFSMCTRYEGRPALPVMGYCELEVIPSDPQHLPWVQGSCIFNWLSFSEAANQLPMNPFLYPIHVLTLYQVGRPSILLKTLYSHLFSLGH